MTSEQTRPTTIVLVEDHASFRAALSTVMAVEEDLVVLGGVDRADQAADLVSTLMGLASSPQSVVTPSVHSFVPHEVMLGSGQSVDVAIVDLDLPGGGGVRAIGDIREVSPATACLVLTAATDPVELGRAVEAGAAAVLHKGVDIPVLLDAIRLVAAGGSGLDPATTTTWLQALGTHRRGRWQSRVVGDSLSPRERAVLELLARGGSTESIAVDLVITPQTVQTHVRNLMGKLDVGSRLEAVTEAIRLGIVSPKVDVAPSGLPENG